MLDFTLEWASEVADSLIRERDAVQFFAGYESVSGFPDAFSKIMGTAPIKSRSSFHAIPSSIAIGISVAMVLGLLVRNGC